MEQTQYSEIEKQVLKTVLEKPDFARWKSLCSLMCDGVYIASEIHDRDLPTRGWLHICARYLGIVPRRDNRDSSLAPNEFLAKEIGSYCELFRPVVRSLQHYMEIIYPHFDSKTGRWSRAGEEDKSLNPFPFFLSDYIYLEGDNDEDNDDGEVALSLLFKTIPKFCEGVFEWNPSFFEILARVTDDYDAELECGAFAGNMDDNDIKNIVDYLRESSKEEVSERELDTVAHMMITSYAATLEFHQSVLENEGKGRFATEDFDRSSLFHPTLIQHVLVVFQPHFIKEIERCGLRIQQYQTSICDAITLAHKVQAAWQSFFRELKRQFNGNPAIVSAESVALSLVNHYAMKVSSEGGGVHVSAETICGEYVDFLKKFERISEVVAQRDYAEQSSSKEMANIKDSIMGNAGSSVNNINIQHCHTVQVNNDGSKGVQTAQNESKSSAIRWIIGVAGSIIAAVVAGIILEYCF